MKKTLITIGIIILVLLILVGMVSSPYNSMVNKQENVKKHWSQVENVYQRRADLIPNLVNTVKGYAEHEKSTFTAVTDARAKTNSVNIDASNLTPEKLQKFQQAQGALTQALSHLMMVKENYPDLKANQNFLELQAQLEGTENRITVERKRFNDAVKEYNTYIRKFPQNMLAGMFGFERNTPYFKMEAGADKAPEVKF